jgi:outer membrane protein assembly factor BamD (BamD/ComL family)
MIKVVSYSLCMLLASISYVSAQQTAIYSHDLKEFDRAIALYKDKQYQSAQILFDKVQSQATNQEVQADCAYYIANCAIRLNQVGADAMIEKFVADYPTSTKQNQALY